MTSSHGHVARSDRAHEKPSRIIAPKKKPSKYAQKGIKSALLSKKSVELVVSPVHVFQISLPHLPGGQVRS